MNKIMKTATRLIPQGLRRKIKQDLLNHFEVPTATWSLENLRRLEFAPAMILDIGAYKGEWTAMVRRVFPEAQILMLEAQEERVPDLEVVRKAHAGKTDYRISLLGADNREDAIFNKYPNAPTGNSVLTGWKSGNKFQVKCKMRTVDSVLADVDLPAPEFIKLDVQGYELEVLKGATKALQSCQVVLMEVSLIDMYQKNPLLHDVTAFMNERDFVAYDICGLMRRPLDLALAQVDIIFVPRSSAFIKNKEYGIGDAI
jgi:FkbM family methyltransferase